MVMDQLTVMKHVQRPTRPTFGHDPQGNPDPNFDQRYDEVDANGDGVVDCGEHDAAVAEGENNN